LRLVYKGSFTEARGICKQEGVNRREKTLKVKNIQKKKKPGYGHKISGGYAGNSALGD
jgi:hypothetical protein